MMSDWRVGLVAEPCINFMPMCATSATQQQLDDCWWHMFKFLVAVGCLKYRFWDMEAALPLIKADNSSSMPVYESFDSVVAKDEAAVCLS